MRKITGILQKVRYVQDMLEVNGLEGCASRGNEVELVDNKVKRILI